MREVSVGWDNIWK